MTDLVIFDCDGVLVDSEIISCRCAAAALRRAGMDIDVAAVMERFLGVARAEMARQVQAELRRPLPADFHSRLVASIIAAFATELRPIEGVREAIAGLRMPRCVASGSDPDYVRRALELTGLLERFAPHLFSATMVARPKPAPDIFLHAAARMGVAPRHCVVIEDSAIGVRAGKAAGMTVFGFAGGSHVAASDQVRKMQVAGSDLIFDSMAQLPQLVREHGAGSAAR